MKRNYILSLFAALMLIPFSGLKAQYDAGDSTVCYNIMTNNFAASNQLNWNDPDPGTWLGVVWNSATPQRIVQLELNAGGGGSGSQQGGTNGLAVEKFTGFSGAGVDASLIGIPDFSALTELYALDLRQNDSITGINVSGLNKLEYVMMCQNAILGALDFSGLANLQHIHMSNMDSLTTLNASNCPRLKRLMCKRGNNTIQTLNMTGSDSIVHFNFKTSLAPSLTTLDFTGKSNIFKIAASRNSLTTLVGLNTLSTLNALCVAKNDSLSGTYDLADYDVANMYKFSVGRNMVDSVLNFSLVANLQVMNVEENHLTLSNATQIANVVTASNQLKYEDQIRYGGDTIYVTGSTDYPGEDTIDISGTLVASTFTLFDGTGTQVGGTNQTGNFMFPTVNDTGVYYVEMTNPGAAPANNTVNLRTDTFWVAECPQLNKVTSVLLTTITVGQSGATYQWLDCDNGNAVIAGATSQSYTATANGNYAVEMTLGGVCKDTSACVNISTVGLDELSSNTTVRAYPNPMNEQVTIELQKVVANTQVTIVNVEGKVVYNNVVNTGRISVDGSTWNNGIYIVKITNAEYTKTLKLIK